MQDRVADSAQVSRANSTDAAGLAAALRLQVRGEVRFDRSSRALYATDGSNYRQVPIGVVLPRDADDVLAAISLCREFGTPLLCRGGGTSLAGQCCNVAVVLDFSKYMAKILEIDPARRIARVQPGVVLDHLRNAAEKHHLTFAPDPASHDRCTIGGMIGNNSCGVHSVMAGKTDDNIEELEVLTYDGVPLRVGADAFVRPASGASVVFTRFIPSGYSSSPHLVQLAATPMDTLANLQPILSASDSAEHTQLSHRDFPMIAIRDQRTLPAIRRHDVPIVG